MNFDNTLDYKLFDLLLKKQIRFALYRLPQQKNLNLLLQESHNGNIINTIKDFNNRKGFAIVPFEISDSAPAVLIKPDIILDNDKEIFLYIKNLCNTDNPERNNLDQSISLTDEKNFKIYEQDYIKFRAALERGLFEKLVLSRSEQYKFNTGFSIGLIFAKALKTYTDAFVYLTHTPETGTWLGCTPELLLSGHNYEWQTVALAGTKPSQEDNKTEWDPKNKQEQQIVVDFVQKQLKSLGLKFTKGDVQTIKAGSIIHLKTEFAFSLNNVSPTALLEKLHPTPAVCGFPQKNAIRFIKENESCNRRYYSGFIGPLDINNRTDLFVNLRCMEVGDETLRLYGGGGILNSSVVITEWLETESKLQTLLSLIEG